MTIGELKAILNQYSDDMPVRITYECDNDFREITNIRTIGEVSSFVSIESDSVPNIDDLSIMAEKSLEQYDSIMMDSEKKLLQNLIGE